MLWTSWWRKNLSYEKGDIVMKRILNTALSVLLAMGMVMVCQVPGRALAGVAGPLLKPYEAIMYGGKYHIVLRQRGDRNRDMMSMIKQFYEGKKQAKLLAQAKESFDETTYVTDGVSRCYKSVSHYTYHGEVSDSCNIGIWKDGKHYSLGDGTNIPGMPPTYPSSKKKSNKLVGTVIPIEQENPNAHLLKDWYDVHEFHLILNEDMVRSWDFIGSGEKEIGGVLHQSETYDVKEQFKIGDYDSKLIFYFNNGRLAFMEDESGLKEVIAFDTEVAASEFDIPAGTTIYQGGKMGIPSLTDMKPPVVEQY